MIFQRACNNDSCCEAAAMFSTIHPLTYIAIRLPSGTHKVVKIIPDTVVSLGKYGSFNSNLLLGRPYHLTFEVLDQNEGDAFSELRVVSAAELHAEAVAEDQSALSEPHVDGESTKEDAGNAGVTQFDLVDEHGQVLMRNNRLTVDDPSRQALSMEEIEELKKVASGSGKDIILKIMASHSALDEKTKFSLAKYALRKSKKFLRRFTVLPLSVSMLAQWMLLEKESSRIMEVREEMLGLIASWSNVHYGAMEPIASVMPQTPGLGRWLVVDDTGGLIVALLAERMGVLHFSDEPEGNGGQTLPNGKEHGETLGEEERPADKRSDIEHENSAIDQTRQQSKLTKPSHSKSHPRRNRRHPADSMSAESNTITLIHPATQPNISLLTYFSYNPNETTPTGSVPASRHPLHTNLKTISWLQLLDPSKDNTYTEPEFVPESIVSTWKSGKRGNYHRKRRRWERIKRVVDETQAGGFDGLVVASSMAPETILHHTVPLLSGGAPVVVFNPNVEPLQELMDFYSSARKIAFINALAESESSEAARLAKIPNEDFPLDPRLLLGASLQTVRAREWQVLPGRTHPLMAGRGGPEGYLFTGTRVLPTDKKVEARGKFTKKRKVESSGDTYSQDLRT